jgi:vitamin B12 transporter
VVQIFTRRGAAAPRAFGGVEIGGYDSARGDAGASGVSGPWDFALSLSGEKSRGVSAIAPGDQFGAFNPDDDGFRRKAGSAALGFTPAPGHRIGLHLLETRLRSQFDSTESLPPDFTPDASPDFRNDLTTRVASIDYRGSPARIWTTTVQLSRSVDDLTSGGTVKSRFVTEREQATWQNAIALAPEQQLVLALERLDEKATADAFGGTLTRTNDAAVLGYSARFGAHSLQADARHDDNSAYGGNTTGRLGYAFEVRPGLKLRALAGTSFRAPTFNDLAFPGFGVPTIRPESGRSVEAGVSWQDKDASASATVYRNRVSDLIGFQPDRTFCPPDPAYDFGCAANVQRALLQGVTLAATKHWGGLDVHANVDFLDATDADRSSPAAPRRAPGKRRRRLRFRDVASWRIGILRRRAARRRHRARRLRRPRPARRVAAAAGMANRSEAQQRARSQGRAGARLPRPRQAGVARRALRLRGTVKRGAPRAWSSSPSRQRWSRARSACSRARRDSASRRPRSCGRSARRASSPGSAPALRSRSPAP